MNINESQEDMLKEIGNIGIGHAAAALSSMVNAPVDITLPSVHIAPVQELFNPEINDFFVVTSNIRGELAGKLLVAFNGENAKPLINMMLMKPEDSEFVLDDMSESAFKELINIIGGAYLDSISQMLNYRLMPEPPNFSYGDLEKTKSFVLSDFPSVPEHVLQIKTQLIIKSKELVGDFFLVLTPDSLDKLMGALS